MRVTRPAFGAAVLVLACCGPVSAQTTPTTHRPRPTTTADAHGRRADAGPDTQHAGPDGRVGFGRKRACAGDRRSRWARRR